MCWESADGTIFNGPSRFHLRRSDRFSEHDRWIQIPGSKVRRGRRDALLVGLGPTITVAGQGIGPSVQRRHGEGWDAHQGKPVG